MAKTNKTMNLAFALMVGSAGAAYAGIPAVNSVQNVQQDETCTGIVKDATGEPVIGASVLVKGTSIGSATDLDGKFTIKGIKKGAALRISYLCFQTIEVVYHGSPLDVTLKEDSQSLKEVVVTALGMKRDKKALGYAVTELKGEDLNASIINPTNALQGKVAGVEINQSDGGMFGTSKILIRGASTLGSNNQPIYVVDGIILDNDIHESSADWNSSNNDYGNELKNLNPADFESVSVLKGAAATALYGSRGLNGAIVITTKSGKGKKGLGINFSQTFGFDTIIQTPGFQNEYGPGYLSGYCSWADSPYNNLAFDKNSDGVNSVKSLMESGYYGWGPKFDGSMVEYVDGTMRPYSAVKNNYRDLYDTGFNSTTNVAFNGGNEKTSFYTSLGYKYAQGTTPNNEFSRFNLMAKASHKITSKVEVEAGVTFSNSKPKNAAWNLGEYFVNGTFARNYDIKFFRNRYKASHGGLVSTSYGDEYGNVPGMDIFWALDENEYYQKETVVRPNVKLTAELTSWLKFIAEGSYNYYYVRSEGKYPGNGYQNEGGSYSLGNSTKEQTNLNVNFNANKQFGDFEVHGFLRGEYYNSFAQAQSMSTNGGLIAHNQYFINNSVNTPTYSGTVSGEKRMLSVAAQAGMSWKDQLFFDVTGRNDWSSSLVYADGHGTYSYFYPSVSGSWLITNSLRKQLPSWISFAKIRASWAQVGNDTNPYMINTAYILNSGKVGDNRVAGTELSSTVYDQDLKPERKNSWELGLDWRFLNNRIGIDATYYKENTKDQIMRIKVPTESGIQYKYINAGNIQNQGIELALNTTPIQSKDWQWDLNFTYTKNKSKIVSLHELVADYITLAGDVTYGNFRIGSVAEVGGEYGVLKTDSKVEVDKESGLNVLGFHDGTKSAYLWRSNKVETIGSINPDFLGSVNTTLRYKNVALSVSLDARFGGYVASYNGRYATAYGFSKTSLNYRDEAHGGATYTSRWDGLTYHDGVIPEGIFKKGTQIRQADNTLYTVGTGQYSTGETFQELMDKGVVEPSHANTWTYWNNCWINVNTNRGVITDDCFHKLNYIALREISLSYTAPQSWARAIGARNLAFTATGHNLGYLLNSLPNKENPESVRGTVASEFRIRNYDGVTANFTFTINAAF